MQFKIAWESIKKLEKKFRLVLWLDFKIILYCNDINGFKLSQFLRIQRSMHISRESSIYVYQEIHCGGDFWE